MSHRRGPDMMPALPVIEDREQQLWPSQRQPYNVSALWGSALISGADTRLESPCALGMQLPWSFSSRLAYKDHIWQTSLAATQHTAQQPLQLPRRLWRC